MTREHGVKDKVVYLGFIVMAMAMGLECCRCGDVSLALSPQRLITRGSTHLLSWVVRSFQETLSVGAGGSRDTTSSTHTGQLPGLDLVESILCGCQELQARACDHGEARREDGLPV